MKGYKRNDKNTIRVSRQHLNSLREVLKIVGSWVIGRRIYYQFTTFEQQKEFRYDIG